MDEKESHNDCVWRPQVCTEIKSRESNAVLWLKDVQE
jgi:hypothetical protein